MEFLKLFKKKSADSGELTAKDRDKLRKSDKQEAKQKKKKQAKQKKVKRTTIDTIPYKRFVSKYVMLLNDQVRSGREILNLYSKTYLIADVNYTALTKSEQYALLQQYAAMLNLFNSKASLQISLVNASINEEDFKKKLLLAKQGDKYDQLREEFNSVLEEKIMGGQHGLQCRKYLTVTVAAINYETANSMLFSLETQLNAELKKIGTVPIALTANERIRLLADIMCGVNKDFAPCSQSEFNRQAEKYRCCPDYFEFERDYFMFNDKYARVVFFKKFGNSIDDEIYKKIIDLNKTMVISENIMFVESDAAITMVSRKMTDMKQEQIQRTRYSAKISGGTIVNPLEGSELMRNLDEANELLEKLRNDDEKMTLAQFVIMLIADSYDELEQNTKTLETTLRVMHIEISKAPNQQEQGFDSVLPIGNSTSIDKEQNLQVRRTLTTSSTAGFCPFNTVELMHEGGLYYGQNAMTKNIILFDRNQLNNPNGFIFGVPGAGKSVTAKLEMLFSVLSTNDEVLIIDPEREYGKLVEMLGGEIIYISESSGTHLNPLDKTENPDAKDTEYDPIKAKLDFLLSFFSAIMGNEEITPIQKTIIDSVMKETYNRYSTITPTLKEYYAVLEEYEKTASEETFAAAQYLRQTLHLYVHGSLNVFSHESNVDVKKRIVCYDLKELKDHMQTLGMMIVLENLWNRMAKNRTKGIGTRIYVDEMYLMFQNEQSADFFYKLYKRARKWGGIPTGITQNVADVLRSPLAQTMIGNTQFVIMLSQNTTDREQLSHLLHIEPETMRFVTNANPGCGLIYADKFGVIPFDNTFPTDTEIYKVITTKFSETLPA